MLVYFDAFIKFHSVDKWFLLPPFLQSKQVMYFYYTFRRGHLIRPSFPLVVSPRVLHFCTGRDVWHPDIKKHEGRHPGLVIEPDAALFFSLRFFPFLSHPLRARISRLVPVFRCIWVAYPAGCSRNRLLIVRFPSDLRM